MIQSAQVPKNDKFDPTTVNENRDYMEYHEATKWYGCRQEAPMDATCGEQQYICKRPEPNNHVPNDMRLIQLGVDMKGALNIRSFKVSVLRRNCESKSEMREILNTLRNCSKQLETFRRSMIKLLVEGDEGSVTDGMYTCFDDKGEYIGELVAKHLRVKEAMFDRNIWRCPMCGVEIQRTSANA